MQWKVSSNLAAITSLLLSAVDLVLADISAPVCTATGWSWAYNSLDQSPCTVTANLLSTCYGGSFKMNPLGVYTEYSGPDASQVQLAGPCWCSTVTYSLMSACSECQGGSAIAWSAYVEFCTSSGASSFPNPVPAGIRVPQWALVRLDTPEILPGKLINSPAVVPTSTKTVAPPPTTSEAATSDTVATALPTTTTFPISGNGNRGTSGSKQVGSADSLVWGVTTMAVISGLVLTLMPPLG